MKINTYSETKLKEKFNCCFKSRSHLHFNKFRFKLFFVVCFTAGLIFALQKVLTNVFATANSSITIDTDEDFEGGSLVSTSIFGSGSEAIVQLSGMAGPDGTQYRREVEITNNSGSTLTDYQVSFTLDTASLISDNKMNANCSDIRFLDSDDSTGINNYWVENCDSDGDSSTKI